jgi:hypothetical protein
MEHRTKAPNFGVAAAVFFALTLTALPAQAVGVTFAQYTQENGADQQWTISVSGSQTTVSATGTADFKFSGMQGAPGGDLPANFLLSATSATAGTTTGNAYSLAGFSGMFSFTGVSLPSGQQTLLSGVFQFANTGAQLNESVGGTGGGFGASDTIGNPNMIVMTSDYIDFSGQTLQTSTFTLSSLSRSFSAGGTNDLPTGGPYQAAGAGTFSSSPGFAPEPGSMFLIGGGMLGLGMVRRRKRGDGA